jgi:hypothetical protein
LVLKSASTIGIIECGNTYGDESMEQFKILNFEKENPCDKFPRVTTLKGIEAEKVKQQFLSNVNYKEVSKLLLEYLSAKSTVLHNVNAEDVDFNMVSIVERLGITPLEKIYINWGKFEEIDQMSFIEFSAHFDDIWYPSADDIDLFDNSFSWIVSITHYGAVKYVLFE